VTRGTCSLSVGKSGIDGFLRLPQDAIAEQDSVFSEACDALRRELLAIAVEKQRKECVSICDAGGNAASGLQSP